MVRWIGIGAGKYHDWKARYGKVNEHNALVPRDHWLTQEEKQAILQFHDQHPLEGYRRLTFMMLDGDVVANQSRQRVSRAERRRSSAALESQVEPEGNGLRAAAQGP